MANPRICATCKHCMKKPRSGGKIPSDGYCYANPPTPGKMRPIVGLDNKACRHHVQKAQDDNTVISNEG